MLMPTAPFKVKVIQPFRELKEGGLKKGAILTVRALAEEQQLGGPFMVYFLIWNAQVKKYMLEPASQFAPADAAEE
jgi:hypothetical protein